MHGIGQASAPKEQRNCVFWIVLYPANTGHPRFALGSGHTVVRFFQRYSLPAPIVVQLLHYLATCHPMPLLSLLHMCSVCCQRNIADCLSHGYKASRVRVGWWWWQHHSGKTSLGTREMRRINICIQRLYDNKSSWVKWEFCQCHSCCCETSRGSRCSVVLLV